MLFVEPRDPSQCQTVVSLGLETKDYTSFKSWLAKFKKTLTKNFCDPFQKSIKGPQESKT
jgi:hypothetical protein